MGQHLRLDGPPGEQRLVWDTDGTAASVTRGEIAGIFDVRDNTVPALKAQVDDIAWTLAASVNALQQTGVTMDGAAAGPFFTGSTAATISVSDAILADDRLIAATRTANAPGDGSLAREIADLSTKALVKNRTFAEAAQRITLQVGNAVQMAQTNAEASQALATQIENQQAAVSGVSMDEELTNLLIYQRAYDAAARVLATSDELLQTLLQQMG
jgi:flagellar hook-associated protein 1 FlgK